MEPHRHVLRDILHGGHILEEAALQERELAGIQREATLGLSSNATGSGTAADYDYLFPELENKQEAHLPADNPARVVAALSLLGDAMVEDPPAADDPSLLHGNSIIPPIYTYWGQFIDHDLTATKERNPDVSDITRADLRPLDPDLVRHELQNQRLPFLNLDSVYGDIPEFTAKGRARNAALYDGIALQLGRITQKSSDSKRPLQGVRIVDASELEHDLPRKGTVAQIADARNDENLIIAQLHLVFLRFHNNAVEWVKEHEPEKDSDQAIFMRARQLMCLHHQWLVVHDYLKTVTLPGMVDRVLLGGNRHYRPRQKPFMPLEFSAAVFRFGHTMVRAVYDYNRNFGRSGAVLQQAPFNLLFQFTGRGFGPDKKDSSRRVPTPFEHTSKTLPFNWVIEWERFVNKGSPFPERFARKIDTRLAPPLKDLLNDGNDAASIDLKKLLKRLARRNLLRGYLLNLPTGQSVAKAMGITPLSREELLQGNSMLAEVLEEHGFVERTPLWYYILKEAEVRANGNSLGELGSRIVCETIIGLLNHDNDSYLHQQTPTGAWDPRYGIRLPDGEPIVTISDFIRFAGLTV